MERAIQQHLLEMERSIRDQQSKPHRPADFPPRGPPKRDAALAGAHKSPTKLDGIVHKKTRAVTTPSNAVAAFT